MIRCDDMMLWWYAMSRSRHHSMLLSHKCNGWCRYEEDRRGDSLFDIGWFFTAAAFDSTFHSHLYWVTGPLEKGSERRSSHGGGLFETCDWTHCVSRFRIHPDLSTVYSTVHTLMVLLFNIIGPLSTQLTKGNLNINRRKLWK